MLIRASSDDLERGLREGWVSHSVENGYRLEGERLRAAVRGMSLSETQRVTSQVFELSRKAAEVAWNAESLLKSLHQTRSLLLAQNRRLLRELAREHVRRVEISGQLQGLIGRTAKADRKRRKAEVTPEMAERLKLAEAV